MRTTSPASGHLKAYLLVAGLLILASATANASYTVIDDDLLPTSALESRSTQKAHAPEHFAVPFPREATLVGVSTRAVLDALLPQMRNATVRIVGRPDAQGYSNGKLSVIARNRAINMRDYLTRQGIPANNILIESDNSPNPQPNGSSYPSDIYITRADGRGSSSRLASYATSAVPPEPALVQPARYAASQSQNVAPAPSAANPARDQLIQFINQAVESGQMLPSVALKLLQTLMEANSNNGLQQVSRQPAIQSTRAPPAPQIVAAPALPRNERWVLDNKLTLKDNIDAWSKTAGWNPVTWEASNYYQVTTTSTIEGGFPDVLRKIADSTGLNICAKTRERYVRVTDANVSCK